MAGSTTVRHRVRRTARLRVTTSLLICLTLAALCAPPGVATAFEDRIAGESVAQTPALAQVAPQVEMQSGILVSGDGTVLWEREADTERAMASTTKMMTALLAIENAKPTDTVTISLEAAMIGESAIPLKAGQVLTVEDLLEATLVHSANNAAFALAEHVGGNVLKFVAMMNDKAAALGLKDTHYTNPHGLDEPGHHTSARDLATLARAAMADKRFAEIAGRETASVAGKTYENTNLLIRTYEGATGVKTGFTDEAGYCVVGSAERDGVSLAVVVLGCETDSQRFVEAKRLLNWGFTHCTRASLVSADTTAALVPVSDYLDQAVAAVVATDAAVPVFDLAGTVTTRLEVVDRVQAPVRAGDTLGTLAFVQGDKQLVEVPIVAASDVPAPGFFESVRIFFVRLWRGVFGGVTRAKAVSFI